MRQRYIIRNGALVPLEEQDAPARLEVITDSLPVGGLVHPCDGRRYESKSKFRSVTKFFGCAETGGEQVSKRHTGTAPGLKQDIIDTIKRHGG